MSIFEKGADVFTMGSYIAADEGDAWEPPCGCASDCAPLGFQLTNVVKNQPRDIAECPKCGATWDDE